MSLAGEQDVVAARLRRAACASGGALLSPLAARSYPALRARAEEDCALRTPFQRDRDRIVHSKAFRRLTHKTQVFVAPRGDHYRTRLTHTLEVTTISRTVARALRLNEDLVEAIGLGHDLGHPPFGHIGEEVLDALPERALRTRLPPLRALAARGRAPRARRRGAQPHRAGARRHRCATRAARRCRQTLEGRIVRVIDRVAYINHDIDDAVRAGLLRERGAAAASRSRCSATAARRGSTRWCTTWSSTPSARGRHRAGPGGGPGDGASCATSCSSACTSGPAVRAEHAQDRGAWSGGCSSTTSSTRSCCRGAGDGAARTARRASSRERVTDYLAGMTDRYCIRALHRAGGAAGVRPLALPAVALYTNESRDRVRDAVDFVELVSARTELRRAGPARYEGLCPFHDERTPSFGIDPAQKVYYCFGCQASGDVFTFVQETEGVDFKGALELLAERYGVELQREQEDPREAERRRRARAAAGAAERARAAYYERYLWESSEAARAREYLAGRGLGEEILREFRVGYAPSAWDRVLLASRRGGFTERGALRRRGWRSARKQNGQLV